MELNRGTTFIHKCIEIFYACIWLSIW